MFSVSMIVLLSLVGVFLLVLRDANLKNGSWKHGTDPSMSAALFGGLALVAAGIWLAVATLGSYTAQIQNFSELKGTQAGITLYEERRDNLVVMVRTELSKYPEYEKKIIGDIKPSILLQFPVLKSNETIVKTVEEIVKLEDRVYQTRAKLIKTQTEMFLREISPWVIYATPYKTLMGAENPVAK